MPTSPEIVLSTGNKRDHLLQQQVGQALRKSGYATLQRVNFCVENGIVQLSGNVPSYYFKQLAQELLFTLQHVQRVENHLCVRPSS